MKVWVFVEGASDCIALETLWTGWRQRLRQKGWGIQIVSLDDKARFFRKIGRRAAEKLVNDPNDLAIGLPDLYPNSVYANSEFRHQDLGELCHVQRDLVEKALREVFQIATTQQYLRRFHASAFKHDAEMLLLAAKHALRQHLGTSERLGKWRKPVEDQNQQAPPKRIVERLFKEKAGRAYLETRDTRSVLNRVTDLSTVLYDDNRQLQCPAFKEMLDWIGSAVGVPAY